MKTELLSPAGNIEVLKMAVKCGADAIYISGKEYGARKYADNFTIDEIEEAIRYCHLYGVKLYVTVNTLIDEDMVGDAINYIRTLHKLGVDALIMQDLGMISYVKEKFPNLEIHASTQTHNVNKESVMFLKKLGCSHVVLARELSFGEISKIKEDIDIELEVFIHGALCVSYSGQCLISSKLFGRSGNKGACAQPCRFKYDLYENGKKLNIRDDYLLSMKELCAKDTIKNLLDIGISSLKIEGRMKSKYYVGYVTKFYRMLIDKYYNNEKLEFTYEEYNNLLKLYNREFTSGFLNSDKDVVNIKTCNHQGVFLGKVVSISDKIKIFLEDDLFQGDGIRFGNDEGMVCNYIYNEKGLLVNKALKGNYIYLDNKVGLNKKCDVFKTLDVKLNKEIDDIEERKIPVSFKVSAKLNSPLTISIVCGENKITKSFGVVNKSINRATTKEDIVGKLSKLGNTPFVIKNVDIDLDKDIFIPLKNINKLRQELAEELISLRQENSITFVEKEVEKKKNNVQITNEISFLVRNELQVKTLIDKDVNIYIEDYNLYNKYKDNKNIYYRSMRAGFNIKCEQNMLITNNGYLLKSSKSKISDIYMNVYNSLTVDLLTNYVKKIGLSPELSVSDICNMLKSYKNRYDCLPNVEMLVYGKLELMLMKYCPIKYLVNKNEKCISCLNNKYYLDDKKGNKFRILTDNIHNIRVLDYQNVDFIGDIEYLKNIGVTNFRIDLLDETENEIDEILRKIK